MDSDPRSSFFLPALARPTRLRGDNDPVSSARPRWVQRGSGAGAVRGAEPPCRALDRPQSGPSVGRPEIAGRRQPSELAMAQARAVASEGGRACGACGQARLLVSKGGGGGSHRMAEGTAERKRVCLFCQLLTCSDSGLFNDLIHPWTVLFQDLTHVYLGARTKLCSSGLCRRHGQGAILGKHKTPFGSQRIRLHV